MLVLALMLVLTTYPNSVHTFASKAIVAKQQRISLRSTLLLATRSHRDYRQVLNVAQEAAYKAGDLMRCVLR